MAQRVPGGAGGTGRAAQEMGRAGPRPNHRPRPLKPWVSARPGQKGAETHLQGLFPITARGSGTSQEDATLLHDRPAQPGSDRSSDEILVYIGT